MIGSRPGNGNGHPTTYVHERPVGELFQDLAQEARTLVTLELALARAEMSEKAAKMGKSASVIAAGGFIAYAGFLAILAAVVIVLADLIPAWLAALLVGIVVAIIGYALIQKGMNDMKSQSLAPKQTIETLKEDRDFVREGMREPVMRDRET